MYKIYADDILIYDDTSSDPFFKVVSPKLTMEVNAAGSLTLTIPPGNAGYDTISLMTTDISVEKDGKEIWFGRVLQEEKDFLNNRTLTCEGALAFLNDTTHPQATYDTAGQTGIIFLLETFLNEHNSHVPDDRKIYFERGLDVVTVSYDGELDCEVNYETTIECINKFILEKTKGYLIVSRKDNSQHGSSLHVDYYDPETMARTNTQTIEFGKNLMDFTKSLDSAEFATVIVPLGAKSGEEGQEEYLTVEDVTTRDPTDPCTGRFVGSQTGIDSCGWIERVVHFDDCDNADTLYRLARNYLAETQYNTMEISLSALDLHYLSPEIMSVELGDKLHVTSPPHGLDATFTVLKLDIPMDQPQNTMFQLGDTVKVSLTSSTRKVNTELLEQISNVSLNKDEILEAAKANATAIMNQKTNGFITITSEEPYGTNELYVSESVPVFNPNFDKDEPESETNMRYSAKNFWRWNANGLGYTDNYGLDYKATITKDGTIVGERIAAGSIHGSKITAGTLAITKSTGEEALTIGLTPRGSMSFEIGGIKAEDGSNMPSTEYGRMALKVYLERGDIVKVDGYSFEVFQYDDNITPESGFARYRGVQTDEYEVEANGFYRLALRKSTGTVTDSDLPLMQAAVSLSGDAAIITARELQLIGMVRFLDLETSGSTEIHGANIKTGTILANRIDLYSGLTVTNNDEHSEFFGETSFEIDTLGNVIIRGDIKLGEGSSITWDSVEDKPTYIETDRIYSPNIEGGTISGGTITGETIEGGTISGTTISGSTFEVRHSNGDIVFYPPSEMGSRPAGIISYYHQTSQSDNNPEGLAITAYAGYALKLTGGGAGGGLSLDGSGEGIYADDIMFIDHGFATARGVGFGTSAEKNALGSVREGYIFFQID